MIKQRSNGSWGMAWWCVKKVWTVKIKLLFKIILLLLTEAILESTRPLSSWVTFPKGPFIRDVRTKSQKLAPTPCPKNVCTGQTLSPLTADVFYGWPLRAWINSSKNVWTFQIFPRSFFKVITAMLQNFDCFPAKS